MRSTLLITALCLSSAQLEAASTLVWVESQEAGTTALAEELQALAGPTDLLRLLTGRSNDTDLAGQALNAARMAWRQVQLDTLVATLDQAERALMTQPRRGDAARLAEVFAYRAGVQVMNFQADEARATLQAASVLGLKSLPADLTNTLAELWGELNAAAAAGVEIAIRIAPGSRLWIDDQPWDRPTSPTVAPGIHLIGATQTGHVPVWQWVTISPSTTRATLLPQAPRSLRRWLLNSAQVPEATGAKRTLSGEVSG